MTFLLSILSWLVVYWRKWVPFALVLIIAISLVMLGRGCSKPKHQIDEKEVLKAQQAIAEGDRKTAEEVITKSIVAEKEIVQDRTETQAETYTAIQNAKDEVKGMTNQQLADYLEAHK